MQRIWVFSHLLLVQDSLAVHSQLINNGSESQEYSVLTLVLGRGASTDLQRCSSLCWSYKPGHSSFLCVTLIHTSQRVAATLQFSSHWEDLLGE